MNGVELLIHIDAKTDWRISMEILDKEEFEEAIFSMNMEVDPLIKAVTRQKIIKEIEKRGIEALEIEKIVSNDMLLELIIRKYPDDVCLIELIDRYAIVVEGRK